MEWLHVGLVLCSCVFLSLAAEDRVYVTIEDLPNVNENGNSRIVGGQPANIEKYPFAVQLLQSNSLACGGSLITARHVLTAAHCFYNQNGVLQNIRNFAVLAGTRHLHPLGPGARRTISTLIIHERYNQPLRDNDIAVLVLSSSYRFNLTVGQAILPTANANLRDNVAVFAVGWGAMWGSSDPRPQTASPVLNEVQVNTVNHGICTARYQLLEQQPPPRPGQFPVTSNNLCAGILDVGGRDACQGDSGGPLVYSGNIIVGVTAWGYDCATRDYPGVYMRTSAYTNWINNVVQRYNASPDKKASGALLLTLLFAVIFSSKM